MIYRMPVHERLREAAYKRDRYRSDPAYRLADLNRKRARAGKPLLTSADEIKPNWSERVRDGRGRFV